MRLDAQSKNEILDAMQLERRKNIYKDIGLYILTLKNFMDVADEKERKELVKKIKKIAKIQKYFYNPEIKKVDK